MQPTYYRSINRNNLNKKKSRKTRFLSIIIVVIVILGFGVYIFAPKVFGTKSNISSNSSKSSPVSNSKPNKSNQVVSNQNIVDKCIGNKLSQVIIVSISLRHLWACYNQTLEYSSPVVTGMDFLAADLTPTGTFHIENKQTNIVLRGSDSTGSWNDPVSYWMQFLYNQYGAYGFHDATWRPASAFGNISPNSKNASHGCVELPLATAKWLYGYTQIGTTVEIEN